MTMTLLEKGTVRIIDSVAPFIKEFNGQKVTAEGKQGASGETQLFNLQGPGGLFLRDEDVKQ